MTIKLNFNTTNVLDNTLEEGVRKLLYEGKKEETYNHCKNVAEMNVKIAKMFNLDIEACKNAGYLHDISAIVSLNEMSKYAKENFSYIDNAEEKYPFLLHQRISKVISKEVFKIEDIRVLDAIECHTTLKSNPSKYDMSLFIADKLAWDQENVPPFYNEVEKALSISLEKASLTYINYIIDNNVILCPHKWILDAKKYLEIIVEKNL